MEKYAKAQMEVIEFEVEDVITTSSEESSEVPTTTECYWKGIDLPIVPIW